MEDDEVCEWGHTSRPCPHDEVAEELESDEDDSKAERLRELAEDEEDV